MSDIKIVPDSTIKINRKSLNSFLKIINYSRERRAFKIKTTRPKDYLVKPSIGILDSFEEICIEIILLESYKIDEMHKFAIEIFEINYRQNLDTLKRYLKSTQILPLITHRLSVEYDECLEEKEHIQDFYFLNYFCLFYLCVISLFMLIKFMQNTDI